MDTQSNFRREACESEQQSHDLTPQAQVAGMIQLSTIYLQKKLTVAAMKKIDDPPDFLDAVGPSDDTTNFPRPTKRCADASRVTRCVTCLGSLGAPASVHSAPTSTDWTDGIQSTPAGPGPPLVDHRAPQQRKYCTRMAHACRKMPHLTTKKCYLMIILINYVR